MFTSWRLHILREHLTTVAAFPVAKRFSPSLHPRVRCVTKWNAFYSHNNMRFIPICLCSSRCFPVHRPADRKGDRVFVDISRPRRSFVGNMWGLFELWLICGVLNRFRLFFLYPCLVQLEGHSRQCYKATARHLRAWTVSFTVFPFLGFSRSSA